MLKESSRNPDVTTGLQVPAAYYRPGEDPDYSFMDFPGPDATARPDPMAGAESMRDLAYGLVRVLDNENCASGAWNPQLSTDECLRALEYMLLIRAYDDRMFRMQRQGKISFYMKCTGEEAVSVGQAMALDPGDMLFPSYRQQGLQIVRGRDLVDMMCHCLSNSRDNLKGRQMPTFYGWREGNYFSISGNVGTQCSQAVGWAMASAYKGEETLSASWVGEGASAESDFYYALLFAAAYKAPAIINVVNNQWAISVPQTLVACGTTFAARGIGFNIPALRVDGNDLPAVIGVTRWAAERARRGGGPTLIELFTYRREGHSTSDDPDAYRPANEAEAWPLQDPVERFKSYLIKTGAWNEERHEALVADTREKVSLAAQEAESYGTLDSGPRWPASSMFDDVYKECPAHLIRQRRQAGV